MNRTALPVAAIASLALFGATAWASAQETCQSFGPQTPRDISNTAGTNKSFFSLAPGPERLNLCNIHTHTHAEHKAPGFEIFAGAGEKGGYRCNETGQLTEAELTDPADGHGAFHGVKLGDTIEVHWVFTSCDVMPGEGLGSCLSEQCANPALRVEAQAFLLVNDPDALNSAEYAYENNVVNGFHQPKSLPVDTGDPVVFRGSTTGPSFTEFTCSPLQATWSVRPTCARLDIGSLYRWAEAGNVFKEGHTHGVRQLVTEPKLLAPIE